MARAIKSSRAGQSPVSEFTKDDIDLREQIAHIDLMQAQLRRTHQEIRYQPWLAVISGFGVSAALLATGGFFGHFLWH